MTRPDTPTGTLRGKTTVFLAALILAVLPLASGAEVLAAAPAGGPGTQKQAGEPALVKRVQRALRDQGFYKGAVDGEINPETVAALRAYQKQAGEPFDPAISETLAARLENGARVGQLLGRLKNVREQQIEAARAALLSRPETRALAEKRLDDVADPTRDARPCFEHPTVACLLAEAVESAKAIHKDEMRDWALGEILVAQAKSGNIEDAMMTVRRIRDPRLIMVALGNIAEAEAEAGRFDDALAAAAIIPDAEQQAASLAAIALAESRKQGKAKKTIAGMETLMTSVSDPVARIGLLTTSARVLFRTGEPTEADRRIKAALAIVGQEKQEIRRNTALGQIAVAYAESGHPDRAVEILKRIRDPKGHGPVLVSAATAHAEAGDLSKALSLVDNIDAVRYRAVVLGQIAAAQAHAGDGPAATNTIERAEREADTIRFPFARDYAWSRVSLASLELARISQNGDRQAAFERAAQAAAQIKDNQLRSQTLWAVVAARRDAGDETGAELAAAIAMRSTDSIKSVLSRVWVHADVAIERAGRDENNEASQAFRRGLAVAESIDNAWGRARALGKLAATLIRLENTADNADVAAAKDRP